MVTHAITIKGILYGRTYVTCSEEEHHPEKLAHGTVEWSTDDIEWLEVLDDEIIDGWDEEEEENQSDTDSSRIDS
jgi:hypothetical protein